MIKKLPNQKGFVILFTILVSAIVLMIGLGIFSVATRETVLSGTSREAQAAFYAADAGIECALFAQSLPQGGPLQAGSNGGPFNCGAVQPVNVSGTGQPTNPFVFDVLVDAQARTCAHVSVYDTTTPSGDPGARRVISQGYNICNAQGQPVRTNPLLVERDLDTYYELGAGSGTGGGGGGTPSGDGGDTGNGDAGNGDDGLIGAPPEPGNG